MGQMVMTQQEVMGRSLDRASEDTFEDEKVKVGKKTCTCSFTFTVANNGKAKGTGSCDKKCSGNVKTMTLNSATYSYTFGFGVKKGKVKVGKVGMVWAGSSSVFCGATVISDEWILTAAHCTDGTAASDIQVLLGEHDYWDDNDGQVRMAITEIINHPNYDSNTVDNDFALLRMADRINWAANPNIRPACLPEYTAGDYDQWMSTVTGW